MVGGPSQMDLYDYKPKMAEWYDKDLPDSVRMGQRLTTMTSGQARFPIAPVEVQVRSTASAACGSTRAAAHTGEDGRRHGFIRSMHTEAINHEPAITYMQTGNQVTGRPCLGAWASTAWAR
jgi:threonine dehydrogenase-like Zn-dependent dehydrogenase